MAEAAAMPSLAEATRWIGAELREIDGATVGEVDGFFVDRATGDPVWLIAKVGRRRHARLVAVPLRDCAGAAFGVWVAQEGEALRTAPVVDPARPLQREHELTICSHFGIGESVGRAAEIAGRAAGDVTAAPPSD
jgi:PRC-barrel domain protein